MYKQYVTAILDVSSAPTKHKESRKYSYKYNTPKINVVSRNTIFIANIFFS